MGIHTVDEQGRRRTYADRKALSRALQAGEISGDTRVYVPAEQDYALLRELFDLDRLREGHLERLGQAPARPRSRSRSKSTSKSRASKTSRHRLLILGGGGLAVLVVLAAVIGRQVVADREAERAAAHRRQMAADLAAVAQDLKRTVAPPASSALPSASAPATPAAAAPEAASAAMARAAPSGAAPTPAASRATPVNQVAQTPKPEPAARVESPGAQVLMDHLAEVRALNERYQQSLAAVREGFMTPESMGTKAGRKANREKLVKLRAATDTFFGQMKQSKQRLLVRFEKQEGPDPERERKMTELIAFLGRLQAANADLYDRMRDMNEFAEQHPPVISGRSLLFETEPEVEGWSELNGALERSKAGLRALQEQGRQMEGQGLAQLQQQVEKLKAEER